MVVLDRFYQIVETKTANVSCFWKATHILSFIVAAVAGFATALALGGATSMLNYNCLIGAKIEFENDSFLNYTQNGVVKQVREMDLSNTVWGYVSVCNFAQLTPLFLTISAVIWGTYFTILARGGAGFAGDLLSRPWSIVYPCLLFTFIVLVVYLVSFFKLESGVKKFCSQVGHEFNTTDCTPAMSIYAQQFERNIQGIFMLWDLYTTLQLLLIFSKICLLSWIVQFGITLVRVLCVADFELRLITIESKEDEEEITVTELAANDELDDEV